MRNTARKFKTTRESGYGLVFAAFGLIVLLGAAGLSVDIGYLRYQRRLLQSAADSAALAGAAQLGLGGSTAQAVIAAKNDSQLNGFQDGSGNIDVTATRTAINGNNNTMQVQVSNIYPTFFMRIFGGAFSNVTVSTAATAQYLGGRGCIYALTGGAGINVTANVNVPDCNVISNQNITGGGSITAAAVGAHGRSSIASNPPAINGTLQTSDPLSYLPGQGTGGPCITIDWNANQGNGPQTLSPGLYCRIVFEPRTGFGRGAIGAYAGNVTFRPGTYVVTGGLSFQGIGTVSGSGVTFYVAGGSVTFGNQQRIQLRASTNAPYAGVLLFQPAGNANTATITGAGGSFLQGALYFPNATLTMNGAGNSGASQYLILVAKTLNLHTNITSTSNYSSLPNGYSPVRTTALVQ